MTPAQRLAAELAALRERQRQRQAQEALKNQLRKQPPVANTSSTGQPRFHGEGQEYRKPRPYVPPQVVYPFKILYSVVIGETRTFYVGGDRVTPLKLLQLQDDFNIEAKINSDGTGLGNWEATIVYGNALEDYVIRQFKGQGAQFEEQIYNTSRRTITRLYGWGFGIFDPLRPPLPPIEFYIADRFLNTPGYPANPAFPFERWDETSSTGFTGENIYLDGGDYSASHSLSSDLYGDYPGLVYNGSMDVSGVGLTEFLLEADYSFSYNRGIWAGGALQTVSETDRGRYFRDDSVPTSSRASYYNHYEPLLPNYGYRVFASVYFGDRFTAPQPPAPNSNYFVVNLNEGGGFPLISTVATGKTTGLLIEDGVYYWRNKDTELEAPESLGSSGIGKRTGNLLDFGRHTTSPVIYGINPHPTLEVLNIFNAFDEHLKGRRDNDKIFIAKRVNVDLDNNRLSLQGGNENPKKYQGLVARIPVPQGFDDPENFNGDDFFQLHSISFYPQS